MNYICTDDFWKIKSLNISPLSLVFVLYCLIQIIFSVSFHFYMETLHKFFFCLFKVDFNIEIMSLGRRMWKTCLLTLVIVPSCLWVKAFLIEPLAVCNSEVAAVLYYTLEILLTERNYIKRVDFYCFLVFSFQYESRRW